MISTVATYTVHRKAPTMNPSVWFPEDTTDRSVVFDVVLDGPQGIEILYDGSVVTTVGIAPKPEPLPTTGDWPKYVVEVAHIDPSQIASESAFRVTGPGLTNWNQSKISFRFSSWPETKMTSKDINILLMYNDGRVPGSMPVDKKPSGRKP